MRRFGRNSRKKKKEIRTGDLSLSAYRSNIHPQVFFAAGLPSPFICSAYLAGCAVADHLETADLLIGTSDKEDKMPREGKNIRLLKYKTVTDENGVVFFVWKVEKN